MNKRNNSRTVATLRTLSNLSDAAEFARIAQACEADALREATVARNLTTEHGPARTREARRNALASYENSRAMWVHALVALVA